MDHGLWAWTKNFAHIHYLCPQKQQQMKVLILMGSETDKPVMQEAQSYLQYFNITGDMVVALSRD